MTLKLGRRHGLDQGEGAFSGPGIGAVLVGEGRQ